MRRDRMRLQAVGISTTLLLAAFPILLPPTPADAASTGSIQIAAPVTGATTGDETISFTSDIPGCESFTLPTDANAGSSISCPAAPGTYTITELDPGNRITLANVSCNGGDEDIDLGTRTVTIPLAEDEGENCSFENVARTSAVVIEKYNDLNLNGERDPAESGLEGWTFFLDVNNNAVQDATEPGRVTDGSGQVKFGSLEPGASYRVCEILQTGWINTNPGSNAKPCKTTTTLRAGEEVSLSFGNARAIASGARTIGFWRNKNGQSFIKGGCLGADGARGTNDDLVIFLREYNPFKDLSTSANCSQIGTYVTNAINTATKGKINDPANVNAMLKAQMLATALDVYFSGPALGKNKLGAPIFIGDLTVDLVHVCDMWDGSDGTAVCLGIEDARSAFNDQTRMTVNQMLAWASSRATPATTRNPLASPWYGQGNMLQGLAKDSFDAINNNNAFGEVP